MGGRKTSYVELEIEIPGYHENVKVVVRAGETTEIMALSVDDSSRVIHVGPGDKDGIDSLIDSHYKVVMAKEELSDGIYKHRMQKRPL